MNIIYINIYIIEKDIFFKYKNFYEINIKI